MSEWRSILKINWPYMMTATLIAVFLWVAVSADTVPGILAMSQTTIAAVVALIATYMGAQSHAETGKEAAMIAVNPIRAR